MGVLDSLCDFVSDTVSYVGDKIKEDKMGVLDSLCDFVSDTVSYVGDKICDKIDAFGNMACSAIDFVENAIDRLFSSDSANESARNINSANYQSSRNIGQMSAYDRQKATTSEIKRINDEIGNFKSRASKEGETFEVALIDIGRKSIEKLTQTLADSGENFAKQCEAEFKKIKGFVLREISSKISLDNAECTEILSKESGKAKEDKMKDFIDKAIKKAFRNLGDRFVDSVENNVNAMIKTLESKLETRKALANNQVATLEKIKEAKNVEQKQNEQSKLALDLNKKIAILNAIKGV